MSKALEKILTIKQLEAKIDDLVRTHSPDEPYVTNTVKHIMRAIEDWAKNSMIGKP